MADDKLNDPTYLGFPRFSSVPEGLISHIASWPGQLCSICDTLDIASYYTTGGPTLGRNLSHKTLLGDDVDGTIHDSCLGTYGEVSRRALACDFCQLVIKALANTTATELQRRSQNGPKVFLDSVLAGSYFKGAAASFGNVTGDAVDEITARSSKQVQVRCIRVSLDGGSTTQRDNAFIRLLANDAHLLGQKPMYHGRLIGDHASPALLRTWIQTCSKHHKFCDKIRNSWGVEHLTKPRSLRYVDTVEMCLRSRHWDELSDHVALSYVWGGTQGLQLLKSNEMLLRTKGALKNAWGNIPAVIRDAIELVRDLNTGSEDEPKIYLWVDQLCIVQDDPKDKATQIHQMNQIYSKAIVTLIATEGSHADVPLSRHHCHTVSLDPRSQGLLSSGQVVKNFRGLRLLTALPSLSETVMPSVWNTRAWTMQEAELSHASLVFGRHQAIFRCAEEIFREDFVAEITGPGYSEIEATQREWQNSQAFERRIAISENKDWPMTFNMYVRLVESYTQRAMTYRTDVLPAFSGMSQILHAVCAWKIFHGLVEDVIDLSLLWRPYGAAKRRFKSNGDPNQKQQGEDDRCLPTYAWCAWLGPVTYEPRSYHIRSLIPRFEIIGVGKQERRLLRFSQDDELEEPGLSTLEPKYPYAPQDCSYYENHVQELRWVKSLAKNLAYRIHLKENSRQPNIDEPGILQFTTKCVRLVLSTATASTNSCNEQKEGCKRVWLLNGNRKRVGTVWYTPVLDEYANKEVDAILLSKNKDSTEKGEAWQFDDSVGTWDEWCLCNVMLIKRLPGEGLSERLTIGKIHERAAQNGWEETIRLV